MNKKIKIKCENCGKEITILLRFGESNRYAHTHKVCPWCGIWFGLLSYSVFSSDNIKDQEAAEEE